MWKSELEEAIKKVKQGDGMAHLLREHLISLTKSMETLRMELDKIKEEDLQLSSPDKDEDET